MDPKAKAELDFPFPFFAGVQGLAVRGCPLRSYHNLFQNWRYKCLKGMN